MHSGTTETEDADGGEAGAPNETRAVDESFESFGAHIGDDGSAFTRIREWFMVDGDRLFVALSLSLGVFVLLLTLAEIGIISFVNDDSITRLAGGMIAGTFSLVTLVVSINQLILSREFTAAGNSRSRFGGVEEFRTDVAEKAMIPATPASPTRILELLAESINYRARALADAVADHDDEIKKDVHRYVNTVEGSTERIDETLEQTSFGTFEVVSAAIEYDDAWQLYAAQHLRGSYADDLSEEAHEAFDELIETLELFSVGREHFKTTYLQRELTEFSRLTIYTGVPAVTSALLIGLLYADLTGPTIPIAYLPFVVSALVAVVFSPLALLVAYILRSATVTRRTASTGPIIPEKDPEAGPFEVTIGDKRNE